MNVKEILTREPPEVLYHYTTHAGLLGVISAREIWASHMQYLNDFLEFRYAIRIVEDELRQMELVGGNHERSDMIRRMKEGLQEGEPVNICVASFSERSDVLSQWRAYGGRAGGFAVGFGGEFLRAVLGDRFWLVPCEYTEARQHELIRTLLGDVLKENERQAGRRAQVPDGGRPGGNLVEYRNRYAPILKHPAFGEEKEWRIVSPPLCWEADGFGFRAGASMLVPYYRIPLEVEGRSFEIKKWSWVPRLTRHSPSAP